MLALRATGEVTKLQVGSTLNSKRTKLSYKEVCKECRNMPVRRHASGMVFFPVRTSVLFFRLVNAVGESGTLCRCPEPPSPKKIAGEKHDHGVFAVKIGLMNFARSNVMKSGSPFMVTGKGTTIFTCPDPCRHRDAPVRKRVHLSRRFLLSVYNECTTTTIPDIGCT